MENLLQATNAATLVELLQERARMQPDHPAYTFLIDGDQEAVELTFAELDRRARQIAVQLQKQHAFGERALLLYAPSMQYIEAYFGCLYAGVLAVPAYPPHPKKPLPRLHSIIADCEAKFVLTTAKILGDMRTRIDNAPDLAALHWMTTDQGEEGEAENWQAPNITGDHIAFLQYTSGSTSAPKGVMVNHANLLHNTNLLRMAWQITPETEIVSWLPPFHDMGLIGTVLAPLFAGAHVTLMAPFDFLQRPLRWLRAISKNRAQLSGAPNFAYELCLRKVTPEQRDALDLSSWKVAFNAAEPVRAETLRRFAEYFAPAGFKLDSFMPGYGLAEATLYVSCKAPDTAPVMRTFDGPLLDNGQAVDADADAKGARTLVGVGSTMDEDPFVIAYPNDLTLCPDGKVGEIWVSGRSLAKGYWNNPEVTERTFRAHLSDTGQGPFLRTGDLGFIRDGELYITGRIKDLIILQGKNHYPQDLELTMQNSHPAVRPDCCAAFTVEVEGEERLVLAAELDRSYRPRKSKSESADADQVSLKDIVMTVRKAVAEVHEVQVHAIVLLKYGTIPKTSSGKIQRHACKIGYVNQTLDVWDLS